MFLCDNKRNQNSWNTYEMQNDDTVMHYIRVNVKSLVCCTKYCIILLPRTENSALLHILVDKETAKTKQTKISEGTSRQRSGKGAIRKRFPPQKPRWEKTKLTIRHLYHETYRKPNEQLFPNRWPLSYLNLIKNMKTYIRRQ